MVVDLVVKGIRTIGVMFGLGLFGSKSMRGWSNGAQAKKNHSIGNHERRLRISRWAGGLSRTVGCVLLGCRSIRLVLRLRAAREAD